MKYRINFVTHNYSYAIIDVDDGLLKNVSIDDVVELAVENMDLEWHSESANIDGEVYEFMQYVGDLPASVNCDNEWAEGVI